MKTVDAARLALTKFRTRKIRNTFVAFSLSTGLTLVIVLLVGFQSVMHIASDIFVDSLRGRYFALETVPPKIDEKTGESQNAPFDRDAYQREYKDRFGVLGYYEQHVAAANTAGYSFTGDGLPNPDDKNPTYQGLQTSEQFFVQDLLAPDAGWTEEYAAAHNNAIPVVVPVMSIRALEGYPSGANAKEDYELVQSWKAKYLYKEIQLRSVSYDEKGAIGESKDAGVTLYIVGFTSESFIFTAPYAANSMIVPVWAAEKNEKLKALFTVSERRAIVEFGTKKMRDDFVKERTEKIQEALGADGSGMLVATSAGPLGYVTKLGGALESFGDSARIFRNIMLGFAGFILAVAGSMLLSTIGKIAADSKKEIGVYRAIGAQRFDIQKIFYAYVMILVTLGLFIAGVLASALLIGVSLRWGKVAFYQLIQLGTTTNTDVPTLFFLVPQWELIPSLLIVALGAYILGIVASFIPIWNASRVDPIVALREE